MHSIRQHSIAVSLAAAAVFVIVARACHQSVMLDEATSYLLYSRRAWPSHWFPASDNHVLNSILMRFTTSVFGMSELTVRAPAILGGVFYVGAALYLCLRLTDRRLLQVPLLVAMIYNPFVLDYLVAARGYSLAVGFLLAAIAVMASAVLAGDGLEERILLERCAVVSALIGLSFSANFSFAIVDGITILVFGLWAALRSPRNLYLRLVACCWGPAVVIGFLLCGSVLLDFPRGELYHGSKSLVDMWTTLLDASFDEVNPNMVNPLVRRWLTVLRPALPYLAVFAALTVLVTAEVDHWRSRTSDRSLVFTRLLVIIVSATLIVHWVAFHTVHLLLPHGRTGLFFVPLWTLAGGAALAVRRQAATKDPTRSIVIAVLMIMAFYFVACLRLGYFKEWKFDADTKHLYWIVENLRAHCGINDTYTDWRYEAPLNFYREDYANYALAEFHIPSSDEPPEGRGAYVVFFPSHERFIQRQGLRVVYHNEDTGSVVAIRRDTNCSK